MPAIVITDFRPRPIAAVLSLKRMLKGQKVGILVSKASLLHNDFGQASHPGVKRVILFLLKLFLRITIVETRKNANVDLELNMTGVMSSLYSITNDSKASKEKYPELFSSLAQLHYGAINVAETLFEKQYSQVFIFNGRLASSYAVTKRLKDQQKTDIFFYEFGVKMFTFTLTAHPLHNLSLWGRDFKNLYLQNVIPKHLLVQNGQQYSREKIQNVFTRNYKTEVKKSYDVVIFLSSTHEYAALDKELCGMEHIGEVDLVKKVIDDNGAEKEFAVRCHPNQTKDPSWRETLAPLEAYCQINGIDFFSPDSDISSHSLIKMSAEVAVDISSAGIDAILMGKNVQIYGEVFFKEPYLYGKNTLGLTAEELGDFISQVMSLKDYLYQHPMSFSAGTLALTHFLTDTSRLKKSPSLK